MITLGQYIAFKNAGENEINQMVALTGMSKESVEQMSMNNVRSTIASFLERLSEVKSDKLFREIKIGEREYGFHPNLEGMTFKEFVDLDMLLKDYEGNIHKIMSIIYRPIIAKFKDRYEIEPYDSDKHVLRADDMKEMPLAAVNGAMVFFCLLRNDILTTFLKSSEMWMMEETDQIMKEIQEMLQRKA